MAAAVFALIGTLVGVLGTLLVELVRSRQQKGHASREALRLVCAELASEVSHLRDLSHQLHRTPEDQSLQREAEVTHSKARSLQERLRLTSTAIATQEAGRWLIHCAYHQWRSTQGGRGDFWEARRQLDSWLTTLYIETRRELGLRAADVYVDPSEGLPVPGVQSGA
jgi:hypothetical protein